MTEADDDVALMLQVQKGNLEAFEALVEKYKQPLINIISRIIGDRIEAEDLAQKVFLQVHKASDRYEARAKFSTWLFTIARNLSLNELRRRSRHPADSLDANVIESCSRQVEDHNSASASEEALRSELVEKIDEVLNDLPVNQRTAIVLVKEKGISYEEIASILGCSVSAVKSLIHRGREKIKSRIKPYLTSGIWESKTK